MLHSLNAARVIAEFCIVSFHIYFGHPDSTPSSWDTILFLSGHGVSVGIMSFFFVLSGFVSMYAYRSSDFSNLNTKISFWRKRNVRTYPLYVLMRLVGLPEWIHHYLTQSYCWNDLVGLASQLLCLQSCMSPGFTGSNPPSWYISSIIWLWPYGG